MKRWLVILLTGAVTLTAWLTGGAIARAVLDVYPATSRVELVPDPPCHSDPRSICNEADPSN